VTIVGVGPVSYNGSATGLVVDFWLPLSALAALGLYAVVAFAVGERTKEIGIRIALGASAPGVVWTVVRAVIVTVTAGLAAGLAAGLLAALGAGRALSAVLFNVSPSDPVTLLGGMLVLAVVAFVAACIPAMRATRVDPATVLRYQ
jgi:putative ABC transport system permease protein